MASGDVGRVLGLASRDIGGVLALASGDVGGEVGQWLVEMLAIS